MPLPLAAQCTLPTLSDAVVHPPFVPHPWSCIPQANPHGSICFVFQGKPYINFRNSLSENSTDNAHSTINSLPRQRAEAALCILSKHSCRFYCFPSSLKSALNISALPCSFWCLSRTHKTALWAPAAPPSAAPSALMLQPLPGDWRDAAGCCLDPSQAIQLFYSSDTD